MNDEFHTCYAVQGRLEVPLHDARQVFQIVRFLRVSHLLFWTIWVMYRERRRVVHAYAHGNYAVRPDSDMLIEVIAAFRETALELGVLMIKLGQFLSSRPDLLPEKCHCFMEFIAGRGATRTLCPCRICYRI